ncbi:hypothetical protein Bca52824_076707 [Brassica carinata]|uniref:Uncharacterized protein n=1 Tax=Brassica carinata TaxID=52824 RepID=A0A8X7PUH8_BRACI|nr:hypothetical protein Bca52824_076707 [Brassica carinata]
MTRMRRMEIAAADSLYKAKLIRGFDDVDGMGTATWRSGKSPAYFKRGDYVLVLKVGALALKQACKFTKELSKVIAYVYESCSICIRSYKH